MAEDVVVSVFDAAYPWASIAHAVQRWPGVPRVVMVPCAPAGSFRVDGVTVDIREDGDVPGVACAGHQDVDPDAKDVWLVKARRGDVVG